MHKVSSRCLKNGGVKSCGCLNKEITLKNAFNRRGTGEGPLANLYGQYKWLANKRKIEFNLNKIEFKNIILSNCYYCGVLPKQKSTRPAFYKPLIHNGIDRINNNGSYIKGNCVSCCKYCNQAKSNLSLKNFKTLIKKIYKRICI